MVHWEYMVVKECKMSTLLLDPPRFPKASLCKLYEEVIAFSFKTDKVKPVLSSNPTWRRENKCVGWGSR